MIGNACNGRPLTVYGNGLQLRDWLFVEDHVDALYKVASKGCIGETYNIGGHNEKTNIDVIQLYMFFAGRASSSQIFWFQRYVDLITYVKDRPGHDKRYAIDATKIKEDLHWMPRETFDSGIRKTVEWYLENKNWFNKECLFTDKANVWCWWLFNERNCSSRWLR